MPLLAYFAVVGTVLTGLMFAADAYMPRPASLSFASNFDGLPADYKGEPASRRPVRAPSIASTKPEPETTGFSLASEPKQQLAAVAQQKQPAPDAAKPAKPQPRKVVHKKPRQDDDDWFGGNNSRRDFAFGSREPSWRDSWASGGGMFDQPRETRSSRRSASRPNNDFWSFR